jgi:[protein-PII] uridylyltransferase
MEAQPAAAPAWSVGEARRQLRERRQAAFALFRQNLDVDGLLRGLRRIVDEAIADLVRRHELPRGAALVAVGGYGRGELFPHSDVDVLILLAHAPTGPEEQGISALVTALWDCGLELGCSTRSIGECLEESSKDITVQTSLLEARFLVGSRALFRQFQHAMLGALSPQAFFRGKLLELQQRHTKYQDTPYALEPNCKESPGGLRDLQVILWIARAAGLGRNWSELARRGLITPVEARQLRRAEQAFKRVRVELHLLTGRREDRLVFDVQSQLAQVYGFESTPAKRASEVLMQRYYWAAKLVTQLNSILMQNIEEHLFDRSDEDVVDIDADFRNVHARLDIRREDAFEQAPGLILKAFLTMQQHAELKGMSARTLRAIWHARRRIDTRFRRDPANRATFLQCLQSPRGIVHELRRMNELSVLGRYLQPFRRIVGQMQHDLFHAYTVDQHILMVVRNLRRFTMPEHAHEYPLCSQLIADFGKPWLLYVAALFHDIAKGRGGDHSQLGKEEARRFCRDHDLGKDETALVVFLVEHHLTMSQVAQKQDLSDPAVIHHFASLVGSERRLVALYLLTVADIRGTSPKVWNAWKGKLLEDLYRMALSMLGGDAPHPLSILENRKQEAQRLLRLFGYEDNIRSELWSKLDVAYFMRHEAPDIAWQTRHLYNKVHTEEPVVKARLAPIGEGLQVAVYVKDQPDLFARICGYFDSQNMSIQDARIHTTLHGYALDSFVVLGSGTTGSDRSMIGLVEHELRERLAAQTPLEAPAKARLSRLSRHFPIQPSVELRPDERGQYWILSVTAVDRTGLLYSIARVFTRHKINLMTAKVMTLGERVEDTFLIDGPVLNNNRAQIQFETELLEALS